MTQTSDREVVISRVIEGPRRLVFTAYSDVKHLSRWWGPDGFTTTTRTFEFRVGGVWDYTMHGPDGVDWPNHIRFLEIVPPEKLVFVHGEHDGDPESFQSTIILEERGNTTLVTMRALFRTAERRALVVEKYGAIEGGQQTLAHLDAFVSVLKSEGA